MLIVAIGITGLIVGCLIGMLLGAAVTFDAFQLVENEPTEHGGNPR